MIDKICNFYQWLIAKFQNIFPLLINEICELLARLIAKIFAEGEKFSNFINDLLMNFTIICSDNWQTKLFLWPVGGICKCCNLWLYWLIVQFLRYIWMTYEEILDFLTTTDKKNCYFLPYMIKKLNPFFCKFLYFVPYYHTTIF